MVSRGFGCVRIGCSVLHFQHCQQHNMIGWSDCIILDGVGVGALVGLYTQTVLIFPDILKPGETFYFYFLPALSLPPW